MNMIDLGVNFYDLPVFLRTEILYPQSKRSSAEFDEFVKKTADDFVEFRRQLIVKKLTVESVERNYRGRFSKSNAEVIDITDLSNYEFPKDFPGLDRRLKTLHLLGLIEYSHHELHKDYEINWEQSASVDMDIAVYSKMWQERVPRITMMAFIKEELAGFKPEQMREIVEHMVRHDKRLFAF